MNQNSHYLTIDKYQIEGTRFYTSDVLDNGLEREERTRKLRHATILGNIYKHRVRIFFKDWTGTTLETEAKVHTVTEKYVALRSGIHIPIACITNIEFI
jgi:hypothetical protein